MHKSPQGKKPASSQYKHSSFSLQPPTTMIGRRLLSVAGGVRSFRCFIFCSSPTAAATPLPNPEISLSAATATATSTTTALAAVLSAFLIVSRCVTFAIFIREQCYQPHTPLFIILYFASHTPHSILYRNWQLHSSTSTSCPYFFDCLPRHCS